MEAQIVGKKIGASFPRRKARFNILIMPKNGLLRWRPFLCRRNLFVLFRDIEPVASDLNALERIDAAGLVVEEQAAYDGAV